MEPADSLRAEAAALAARVIAGNVRAAARACRWVDDAQPQAPWLLRELFAQSRGAWVVGITGAPGAGKSTLTSALVARCRAEGKRVGVVAVDPTSPFTGGAILGDRIRMQHHFEDPEVFIRSVATRGALGGLSRTAADIAVVLGAWGAEIVFLETVGVGQDELDVARVADTTLVVVAPGLGDDIQALKAGILECADVFAVNKADRAGAHGVVRDLELMLALAAESRGLAQDASGHPGHGMAWRAERDATESTSQTWTPPIVQTIAVSEQGVPELYAELQRHRACPVRSEHAAQRLRERLLVQLRAEISEKLESNLAHELDLAAERIVAGTSDLYTECERLWRAFRQGA